MTSYTRKKEGLTKEEELLEIKKISRISVLSIPTVVLMLFSFLMYGFGLYCYFYFNLSIIGFLLQTIACVLLFTPVHDAAHGSVSKYKFLNDIIGRICSPLYPFNVFPTFRFVHDLHHKHTNHPIKDPDNYSSHGPIFLLPFRFSTQIVYYNVFYLNYVTKRPILEVIEYFICNLATITSIICFTYLGYIDIIVMNWLLPAFAAQILLVFFLDFLPHSSETSTPLEDRYHTTAYLRTNKFLSPILSLLMMFQDYHILHHLYPRVAFYKYKPLFHLKKEYLLKEKKIHVKAFLYDINNLDLLQFIF